MVSSQRFSLPRVCGWYLLLVTVVALAAGLGRLSAGHVAQQHRQQGAQGGTNEVDDEQCHS